LVWGLTPARKSRILETVQGGELGGGKLTGKQRFLAIGENLVQMRNKKGGLHGKVIFNKKGTAGKAWRGEKGGTCGETDEIVWKIVPKVTGKSKRQSWGQNRRSQGG